MPANRNCPSCAGCCRDVGRVEPLDVAVAVIDRLRRLDVVAGEEAAAAGRRADVAEARPPRDRRVERLRAVASTSAENATTKFVGSKRNSLRARRPAASSNSKTSGRRLLRRVDAPVCVAGHPVERRRSAGA